MSLADAISANRPQIIEMLTQALADPSGAADVHQFVIGYVNILAAAAEGDYSVRDEYLASVVPSLHAAGFPLSEMVGGLLRIATAVSAVLGTEHAGWLGKFFTDYATRMLALWGDA